MRSPTMFRMGALGVANLLLTGACLDRAFPQFVLEHGQLLVWGIPQSHESGFLGARVRWLGLNA
jgi:hypothetical protein